MVQFTQRRKQKCRQGSALERTHLRQHASQPTRPRILFHHLRSIYPQPVTKSATVSVALSLLSDFHLKERVASRATGGMLSFLPWKSQNGLAMRAFAIHRHLAVAPFVFLQATPFAHAAAKLQKAIIFSLPFHDIFRKEAPYRPHEKDRFDPRDNIVRKRKSLQKYRCNHQK